MRLILRYFFSATLMCSLIGYPIFTFAGGAVYYTTKISTLDRYNSKGKRLLTINSILRQNRANAQSSNYFNTKKRRKAFDYAKIWVANNHLKKQIIYSEKPIWLSIKYSPSKNLFEVYQPD